MKKMTNLLLVFFGVVTLVWSQSANQPKVAPGPSEPNWWDVLEKLYQLDMFGDLSNPVSGTAVDVPGHFVKARPGPVVFEPVLALGTEQVTRGGWYGRQKAFEKPVQHELWSYLFKHSPEQIESGQVEPPPLESGSSVAFDPGNQEFGLWVSNENFPGESVYSEPKIVAQFNERLSGQPYKLMIYALPDEANAYLLGWEYSTNDDFQDVVCVIRNVVLK